MLHILQISKCVRRGSLSHDPQSSAMQVEAQSIQESQTKYAVLRESCKWNRSNLSVQQAAMFGGISKSPKIIKGM